MKTCDDQDLSTVTDVLRFIDPSGERTALVLRKAIDQIYDGRNTGRYRWDQLFKAEKNYFGNLVEILIQKEFGFEDGEILRFRVGGIETNLCYSRILGEWLIPDDAKNEINLLLFAVDDSVSIWGLGVFRAREEWLSTGCASTRHAALTYEGLSAIRWIRRGSVLPANLFFQIDENLVRALMDRPSYMDRICELFRIAQGRIVRQAELATVARKSNFLKAIRRNGGARTALGKEGIIILGQYDSHARIAKALNLPVPGPGDSVSIRVVPAEGPGPGIADISGSYWRSAVHSDPVVTAPVLPCV